MAINSRMERASDTINLDELLAQIDEINVDHIILVSILINLINVEHIILVSI